MQPPEPAATRCRMQGRTDFPGRTCQQAQGRTRCSASTPKKHSHSRQWSKPGELSRGPSSMNSTRAGDRARQSRPAPGFFRPGCRRYNSIDGMNCMRGFSIKSRIRGENLEPVCVSGNGEEFAPPPSWTAGCRNHLVSLYPLYQSVQPRIDPIRGAASGRGGCAKVLN